MNIIKISHPTVFNIILTSKVWGGREGLAGEPISFIGGGSIKFLGMRIQVPNDVTATKEALTANLDQMLQEVDTTEVCRFGQDSQYSLALSPPKDGRAKSPSINISLQMQVSRQYQLLTSSDGCVRERETSNMR